MDLERLEAAQDDSDAVNNSDDKISESDVSGISRFQKLQKGFTGLFTRLGLCCLKIFARILLGLIKGVSFFCSEIWELVLSLLKGIVWLGKTVISPFKERMQLTEDMRKSLLKAKKEGGRAYRRTLIKCVGSYLFGEDGVCYTAFNYILPIVSAAFLIGIIRYGSELEYGLCVEYNGKEIGIISAEADFEAAAQDVQQRISYNNNDEKIDFSPEFSLRIISDDELFMNSTQLADEMLAVSNQELTEACGIYIDGQFIGAVHDREPVEDALTTLLLNYKVDGIVRDVSFKNDIEYIDGIYLSESVMQETEAVELLTSQKQKTGLYVVKKGDSPAAICQKYNMELEKFEEMNPLTALSVTEGQLVTVIETESYLPIQYIREMETLSFLDYETIEVETSSLNVGTTALLVKGEKGEKRSNVEITYVDGVEASRKILSSEITKDPIVEQIGIGTYTAKPASTSTKLYGSGQFGWPVDGGYISDVFISDRNHKGLDIAAPAGTDIYAAADGVVVSAGWNTGGYGFFIMIDHFNGYQTIYGHCSSLFAVEGQTVTRGQLIAAVGTTGQSTGNHCHFEVRYMGMCYDPASFLNTVNYDD